MTASPTPQDPIAIIGLGCVFPKAEDGRRYWSSIRRAEDGISEVPETHWSVDDYFNKDPKSPDRTYAQTGGFLPKIEFSPLEFGMPPKTIEATDTSQLLGMYVAQQALKDSGYGPERDYDRRRISVILGVTGALELVIPLGARLGHPKWKRALEAAGVDAETSKDVLERISDSYVSWQEASFPGLLGNVVAGRIANKFDFGGTNCVVDAACASSLSAIHLAILELQAGRSEMVVTGGVDTFNDIFMYMCFSKTPALSPTGHSRPFDAMGDGTILGEGLGIVVLKRLSAAERDNDKIYAIIRGMGSSSDGKGHAIYAPSSNGQRRCLEEAYKVADVTPDTIEMVEAHGTGTKVGDATELRGLTDVYKGQGGDKLNPWCALGSVKSQIGHTKAAAGSAGLIKTALALYHKVLPPTLKIREPLPALADEDSPFYVNTSARPWPKSSHPRRAALSSFGFGGSNFHCVLEEYQDQKTHIDWDGRVQIVALSGLSAQDIGDQLKAFEGLNWSKLESLAAESRARFDPAAPVRLVVPLEDSDELGKKWRQCRSMLSQAKPDGFRVSPDGIALGTGAARSMDELAVVFPGQGSQYVGMLRELSCRLPEMLDTLDLAHQHWGQKRRLSELMFPPARFNDNARRRDTEALTETDVAQPAIGVASLGAYQSLRRFGLEVKTFAGHSFGELTALAAAGQISQESFLKLAIRRGQLMAKGKGDRGSMLAVKSSESKLQEAIDAHGLAVIIANKNSPTQCVLSGATTDIEDAAKVLKDQGFRCKQLEVAAAFHSRFVSDAADPFEEFCQAQSWQDSDAQVFANSTAQPYPSAAKDKATLLGQQIARPVEFCQQIQAMYEAGVRTFFEVGPGNRLTGLVKAILGDQAQCLALDSSSGKRTGFLDLARALSQLAAMGFAIRLQDFEPRREAPAPSKKKRLTMLLSGANHRDPVKARPARKALAGAKPSTNGRHQAVTPSSQAVKAAPAPAVKLSSQRKAMSSPSHNGPTLNGRSAHSAPQKTPIQSPNPAALQNALAMVQQNLSHLQQLQQQSSQLHERFMQGQEQAQQGFQQLYLQQQQMLMASLGMAVEPLPVQAISPAPSMPTIIPQPIMPQPVVHTPAPVFSPAPPASTNGHHHSQPATAPVPPKVTTPAPKVVAVSASSQPIKECLLEVVSEKTGYPADMLELDMGLDADLGIDSIKRVEILSALQERIPSLPAVKSDEMGRIQTLKDIVELLNSGDSVAPSAPAPSNASHAGVESVLLEVVSEKTGYPADMLELDMGLDADLGIDSIKRVEILSALQERIPSLPAVKSDEMGRIQTLKDIVEILNAGGPATQAAPSEAPDTSSVATQLLEVVSEKTGYPADMLELDMGLDADLGIDSIKRVEILSALQERIPSLPAVKSDEMGRIQTLKDIIEILAKSNSGPMVGDRSPDPTLEPSVALDASALPETRFLQIQSQAHSNAAAAVSKDSLIGLLEGQAELSEGLGAALSHLGYKTQKLSFSEAAPAELGAVILTLPKQAQSKEEIYRSLSWLQASMANLARSQTRVIAITQLGGSFAVDGFSDQVSEDQAAVYGLMKTLRWEHSEIPVRVIDCPEALSQEDCRALAKECLRAGPIELGWTPERCYLPTLSPATSCEDWSALVDSSFALNSGDLIVVSGGARGVTADCAVALASQHQGVQLVLLGRSSATGDEAAWLSACESEREIKAAILANSAERLSPRDLNGQCWRVLAAREIRRTMARLRAAGAGVEYLSVDIRDQAAVTSAIQTMTAQYGPVRGLVHGAGVLADRLIVDKTFEQFDRVFGTKIDGLRNLLAAVDAQALRALLCFSSTTARFGRKGQVDYAMANEVLNKTSQRWAKSHGHCRVISMNWGPWDGGMVTPALKKVFQSEGIEPIPLLEGAHTLAVALSRQTAVEVSVLGRGSQWPEPELEAATAEREMHRAFEREVSVANCPCLKSHVMDGRAVVPAALMMEWLAHAALHRLPGMCLVGMSQFQVLKGMVLEAGQSLPVRAFVSAAEKIDKRHSVVVELRSGERVHARATVTLRARPVKSEEAPAVLLNEAFSRSMPEVYASDLFHGPDFQVIEEILSCSQAGIDARVRAAPRPKQWIEKPLRSHWLAEPAAMDAAFQLMIVWTRAQRGQASLPCAFEQYHQFQKSFPKNGCQLRIRVTDSNAYRARADVEFVGDDGALIARMTGYECMMNAGLDKAFRQSQLSSVSPASR